ncbi:MAG: hypothetical protein FJ265_03465 [Planctomycetes bacterium]|nr:hypothetical protein [Planctomycetota bacterium]
MHTIDQAQAQRSEALQMLDDFRQRLLPSTVWRIAAWKRIPAGELPDLLLELYQELALDCLEHAATIVALPKRPRHSRWMRLAERWVYRNRVTWVRRDPTCDPDEVPGAAPDGPAEPEAPIVRQLVRLANGRCNLTASARTAGKTVHAVRVELEAAAATAIGPREVEEHHAFWRRRLGEALIGLAADLLRDRGAVQLLRGPRPRPDPGGRLWRLRRLANHFPLCLSTREARRALAPWARRPRLDDRSPRRLLERAVELCPQQPAGWLWLFEARMLDRDLAGAARAIRRCRRTMQPSRSGQVLARARLLEARGRAAAALALVRRARRRWPRDPRLRLALATIEAGGDLQRPAGARFASADRSVSASSRSAAASPRAGLQPGRPTSGLVSQRSSTTTASPPPSRNTEARRSPGGSPTGTQGLCIRNRSGSTTASTP